MKRTASVVELKARLSEHLRLVKSGHELVVTERGVYRRDGPRLEFLGAPLAGDPSALSSPVCYADELDPGYFGEDGT